MEERSSREGGGGTEEVFGMPPPVVLVAGCEARLPGCRDCRPRGVSRITRKCPVKGGARAAGRASGSIYM
jgi:hypothetical protein